MGEEFLSTHLTELFLIGLLVFMEIRSTLERRNLMDRLMADDYAQYHAAEMNKVKVKLPKEDLGIPIGR